jgi:DNA invertase Pin-like site-specific DNA recombinase
MGHPAIMYGRVSTGRQGRSGLGLDAQRNTVAAFAAQNGFTVHREYIEVETGKGHDALARRPKLAAALADAKKRKAPVIVAKLCRLGRDVHFISGLMSAKVPFIVAELGPEVDPFMLHVYAAMAQKEGSVIAQRTKEALQAAKRRGRRLGVTGVQRAAENKAAADAQADRLAPLLAELEAQGVRSVRGIAAALNEKKVPSARGGQWHATAVARLLARYRQRKDG